MLLGGGIFADENATYSESKNNVQFGIYPDLQVLDKNEKVYGIRCSFPIAENSTMIGLDFGGFSRNTKYFYGALFNLIGVYNDRNAAGVNATCIFHYTAWNFNGFSFAGVFNNVFHRITGLQASLIANNARQVSGMQFSLFNYCEDLNGVQLGLVNIYNNGTIPFSILVNFGNNVKSK
jgi:hypothetical protein